LALSQIPKGNKVGYTNIDGTKKC